MHAAHTLLVLLQFRLRENQHEYLIQLTGPQLQPLTILVVIPVNVLHVRKTSPSKRAGTDPFRAMPDETCLLS